LEQDAHLAAAIQHFTLKRRVAQDVVVGGATNPDGFRALKELTQGL